VVSGVWCRHNLSKAEESECQNFGLGVRPCIHTYSRPTFNIPDCSDWITFLCGFLWGKVLQNKDGCPIENVGHDGGKDGCPITPVGHDGGEGSG
jgi:hypothetical protein